MEDSPAPYVTDLQRVKKVNPTKRTLKYLAVCPNPTVYKAIVRTAPDTVVKAISNAAYNVERGDITLTPAQKALFNKHRKQIAILTSRKVSVKRKRESLAKQTGGFFWLPALISTAISGISSLFNRG